MKHLFVLVPALFSLAAPTLAQSLPDWSGVWVRSFDEFAAENERWRNPTDPGSPPLSAKAEAARATSIKELLARAKVRGSGEIHVAGACGASTPAGMPQVMRFAFGIEFLFTPGRVTMLLEQGPTIRRVFTDGRTHRADVDPTFAGESVGRWDGDTLIVDTRAIRAGTQLTNGVVGSGRLRLVEKIRLADPQHLRIETVVEDPVMLSAPWHYSRTYTRTSEWFERTCENDRDGQDREPDLTPPPR
jgi:hypothetical protein